MISLPAEDLRQNRATWAVPTQMLPAVASAMIASLPPESFDPQFQGQQLLTTYFDTPSFKLRKARRRDKRYLTLRVRYYQPSDNIAFSAKTEDVKFRTMLSNDKIPSLLSNTATFCAKLLPGDLRARLYDLIGNEPLVTAALIDARRYSREDAVDRFTLDTGVLTDTGKRLPAGILEFKSTLPCREPPDDPVFGKLRLIKLSKFLWATDWRS